MSSSLTTPETIPDATKPFTPTTAGPVAAAAFAAGIAYAWLEALWRLLFTYNPDFDARWVLWNGRVGDIAAMWLTISVLAVLAGLGFYLLWKRRDHVGHIAEWTIGEIGTPAGSVADGAGSTAAVVVFAYSLLVVVIVVCGALILRLRRR